MANQRRRAAAWQGAAQRDRILQTKRGMCCTINYQYLPDAVRGGVAVLEAEVVDAPELHFVAVDANDLGAQHRHRLRRHQRAAWHNVPVRSNNTSPRRRAQHSSGPFVHPSQHLLSTVQQAALQLGSETRTHGGAGGGAGGDGGKGGSGGAGGLGGAGPGGRGGSGGLGGGLGGAGGLGGCGGRLGAVAPQTVLMAQALPSTVTFVGMKLDGSDDEDPSWNPRLMPLPAPLGCSACQFWLAVPAHHMNGVT